MRRLVPRTYWHNSPLHLFTHLSPFFKSFLFRRICHTPYRSPSHHLWHQSFSYLFYLHLLLPYHTLFMCPQRGERRNNLSLHQRNPWSCHRHDGFYQLPLAHLFTPRLGVQCQIEIADEEYLDLGENLSFCPGRLFQQHLLVIYQQQHFQERPHCSFNYPIADLTSFWIHQFRRP